MVQVDDVRIVLLGREAGGHTSEHSVAELAKRHRTTSLSLSIVGIIKFVGTPTGILTGEIIVATGGLFNLPVSDLRRRSIVQATLQL